MKDGLNYKIYQQQKLDILNRNSINWASKVKCLLYTLGMNFVWDQQDTVDMSDFTYYFNILKIRLRDQYMQQFFGTISNNARLQKYSVFKTVFLF